MKLLFMMPQWNAVSEVWMNRMLEGLVEYIGGLVVNDSAGVSDWNGLFPVYYIKESTHEVRFASSLFKSFGFNLLKESPSSYKRIKNIFDELSPSQILCHYGTFAAHFSPVWSENDFPLFIHFHGFDATFDLRQNAYPELKAHPEHYLSEILSLQKRATFIANSFFTKSLLVRAGIAEDCIKVKYYGIPVPELSKTHSKTTNIKILHLGRLVDFKSPDRTIKAFEIAKSRGLDATLIIAGDGPLRNYCELLRLRSPYKDLISFLGPVNRAKAQELFYESDIFTHHNIQGEITRQSECFGVSPVEAMAVGLPYVGTKNGGVLESVVHGETGFLNEPGDVEAQADSFLELARNPELRQRMGDAGRKRVAEHFSPEQERDRLVQIMGLQG